MMLFTAGLGTLFLPTGMTKNGNSAALGTTYAEVPGWIPEAARPGSIVVGNALIAVGGKANAVVSASCLVANSQAAGVVCRLALYRGGSLLHEGLDVTVPAFGSATVTVNVSAPVPASTSDADPITLRARAGQAGVLTIQGGTDSRVRIT